jgi:hypothetical protein
MKSRILLSVLLIGFVLAADAQRVAAQTCNRVPKTTPVDELCDPAFQNCRIPLIDLINNEKVGIDVAWWFMEDSRYATALVNAWNCGVPVRVIIDTEANPTYPSNKTMLATIKNAGIPMREKTTGGILHWKTMIFEGQRQVEFSGANYSADAFVFVTPYVNYVDELIYFTSDPAIVNSFQTKYDDLWTSTTGYANYANITTPLQRKFDPGTISSEMNFPPGADFANRSVGRYNAETKQIDAIMFRITDRRHVDALINAMNRNVVVRLITEPDQYRDPTRLWHSWNVDRLYMAILAAKAKNLALGSGIKHRAHAGLSHEKMTILYNQRLSIFGSSNWTSPSANSQQEHNIFTTRAWMFDYGVDHFNRKWDNLAPGGAVETQDFVPLPPDKPTYVSPTNGASNQPTTLTLKWYAGPWAHKYDIYLGTDPNPTTPLVTGIELGPSESSKDYVTYAITTPLEEGKQYYWKVVSKTMAEQAANGPIWSFVTTGGTTPTLGAGDVNIYASNAPVIRGKWSRVSDSTAAGGFRLSNPNAGAAKVTTPSATPLDYFEATFTAVANTPYHLSIRGKATSNNYNNDSVYVQFSNSVTQSKSPTWRIGSASAATITIEDCSGCGLADWGWNDNTYAGIAAPIYFDVGSSGPVTVRVQVREDGLSIDQILLSPAKFLSTSPGAAKFDINVYPEATGGAAPPPPPPPDPDPDPQPATGTLVLHPGVDSTRVGAWTTAADSTAVEGFGLVLPNTGRPKVTAAAANPTEYAEVTVQVKGNVPYHLWIRGKAPGNSYASDSVFVQFTDARDQNNNPIYTIGTTRAAEVNLEDCSSCGLSGWGWQDNAWGAGVPAQLIYFPTDGTQTIRIQNREDGLLIDHIMLSPDAYLTTPPGTLKNDTHTYPVKKTP